MTNRRDFREQDCPVCQGCGVLPVANIGKQDAPVYAPSPRVAEHFACGKCSGTGLVIVEVVDPRRQDTRQADWYGQREEAMNRSDYERETS